MHFAISATWGPTAPTRVALPFGPPPRFEEVLSHAGAKMLVCKPCATVRYLSEANLDKRVTLAGMNEFHAAAARENVRVVCF